MSQCGGVSSLWMGLREVEGNQNSIGVGDQREDMMQFQPTKDHDLRWQGVDTYQGRRFMGSSVLFFYQFILVVVVLPLQFFFLFFLLLCTSIIVLFFCCFHFVIICYAIFVLFFYLLYFRYFFSGLLWTIFLEPSLINNFFISEVGVVRFAYSLPSLDPKRCVTTPDILSYHRQFVFEL